QEYEIPAQMSMQVVTLTPKTLAADQEIAPEEIETYYDRHKDEFTRPEQVKARHILIRVDQEASEEDVHKAREQIDAAAERVEQGADFAQVAKDVSQGPSAEQGGDLDWFGRDSMVPDFEKAAFALQPGEVSEPVRTKFGFHLIKVTDRREAGVQPLDEVQEKIRSRLARDKAMQVLEDRLDEVLHIVLTSGDLQQAAKEVGLQVQDIGPFSRENPPEQFDLSQKQVNTLMQMQVDEVLDTPIMLDNGYLVVQKTGHEPAHIPDLDQIEDTVREAVTKDRAGKLAEEAAQKVLSQLEQGQAVRELDLQVETSQPFSRQGEIPGLGRNQDLVQAVFDAKRGQWLQKPYELADAVVVARLADLSPPEDATWETQKDFWMDNVRRIQEQALFQAYMQGLREAAQVSIEAPEALEYS
ncbi:MAG: peptidyl-prolyl cis-trans isomerase, partial [Desulfovermiculus sp.]